jgi:hypothetical protein
MKDPANDYSRIYESGGVAYQKWGVCNSGTASTGDLGDAYVYTSTALGSNSYMNWGYGYMNTPMTAAGKQYLIDNKAYYISGPTVTNPAGLTGTAAYSGPAYGTYWSSTGGINMTGSFGCDVNYSGSAQISKFALSVSGSGAEASISDAFGSIGSDGHFQVSGGTWNTRSDEGLWFNLRQRGQCDRRGLGDVQHCGQHRRCRHLSGRQGNHPRRRSISGSDDERLRDEYRVLFGHDDLPYGEPTA